ncbi:hypothetical protein ACDI110481_17400 [Acinetobacter dispersus]
MVAASAGTSVKVPVMVTLPAPSAALITLSAVTALTFNTVPVVSGAVTSTVYTCVSVRLLLLPAASVNFTLASMVLSPSATKPLPGTLTLHVPAAVFTVAVYVTPFTTTVTTVVTASAGTPVNVPVKVTFPVDSAAFNTLSAVTLSTVKVVPETSGPKLSMVSVPGTDGFPAGSVAIAVTVPPFGKLPGFGVVHTPVVGSVGT